MNRQTSYKPRKILYRNKRNHIDKIYQYKIRSYEKTII